jgi:hypothetical protein
MRQDRRNKRNWKMEAFQNIHSSSLIETSKEKKERGKKVIFTKGIE